MRNRIRVTGMTATTASAAMAAVLAGMALWSCAEERPTQPGPARNRVYADFTGDRVWEDSNDIFDLESMQHMKHFGVTGPDIDSFDLDLWPFYGQAHFVPGTDLIVGGGPPGIAQGVGPLFFLSLRSMAVEHVSWSPLHLPREGPGLREGAYVGGMAVGPRP